jgi:hypothetical protein
MNAIGFVAVFFFLAGCAGAIVSGFYRAYHLVMGRFASTRRRETLSHRQKARRGALAFLGCGLFVLFSCLIGAWLGGWQAASGH